MTVLPAPLVPAEVDLTPLDGFMLNTTKLLSSQLCYLANGAEFKAAVMLWCQAWKEIPAASLPDDDKILSKMVRVSPAVWRKIRAMALRGFIKCSDGRLYHKVLANDALKAWAKRQDYAVRRENERRRLAEWRDQKRTQKGQCETPDETRFTSNGNGQDSGKTGTGTGTKEERKTEPNGSDSGEGAAEGFVGKLVRLTREDFDRWRKAYHGIPDIVAELTTLDAYYDHELQGKDRKNWFIRCSSALDKKHQAGVVTKAAKRDGGYVPQHPGAGG